MESVSVLSCSCSMCLLCVHNVPVLIAAFCMTCNWLMLDEDARGKHMKRHTLELVSWLPCR